MADQKIEIDIDTVQAELKLQKFKNIFDQTASSVEKAGAKMANTAPAIDKVADAMTKLDAQTTALKGGAVSAVENLSSAMSNLQSGNVVAAASNFSMLATNISAVIPSLISAGSALLNFAKNLGSLSLVGLINGFSAAGAGASALIGRVATLAMRVGTLAIVATIGAAIYKFAEALTEASDRAAAVAKAIQPTIENLKAVSPAAAEAAEGLAKLAEKMGMSKDAAELLKQSSVSLTQVDLSAQLEKDITTMTASRDEVTRLRTAQLAQLESLNALAKANGSLTTAQKIQVDQLVTAIKTETDYLARVNATIEGKTKLARGTDDATAATQKFGTAANEAAKTIGESTKKVDEYVGSLKGVQAALPMWERLYNLITSIPTKLGELASKQMSANDATKGTTQAVNESSEALRGLTYNSDALATALRNVDSDTRNRIQSAIGERDAMRGTADELMKNADARLQESKAIGESINPIQARISALERSYTVEAGSANASSERINSINSEKSALEASLQAIFDRQNALEGDARAMQAQADSLRQAAQMREADAMNLLKYRDALTEVQNGTDKFLEGLNGTAGKMRDVSSSAEALKTAIEGTNTGTNTLSETTKSNMNAQIDALKIYNDQTEALKRLADGFREAASAKRELDSANSNSSTDTNAPKFSEGGIIGMGGAPMQSAPISAWSNARSFAEGTASTTNLAAKLSGGGRPVIAHANEAIVPLSKGRSIPVELSAPAMPAINVQVPDMSAQLASLLAPMMAMMRMPTSAPSVVNVEPDAFTRPSAPMMESVATSQRERRVGASEREPTRKPASVVRVEFSDLDRGIGRTDDQRARELSKIVERSIKQNG